MSSTNKTSLGLNQWVLSDQPVMNDFNSDNSILNAAIAALQKPIDTVRIADGAVTTPKIADGAVTGEKLSGYPGTYLSSDDIDDVTDPGLYVTPNATLVSVYEYGNPSTSVAQIKIDTECKVSYRNKTEGMEAWAPWRAYSPIISNGSITAEKLADVYTKAEHPDVPVDFNTLTTPGFYAVSATWNNPEDRYINGPDMANYSAGGNYDRSLSVWVVPGGFGAHGTGVGVYEVYYDGLMQVAISIPYKKTWIRRQTVPYDQPEAEPSWSDWEETPANVLPYQEDQTDPDALKAPGLYSIGADKYLVIPHNNSRITLCQIRITTYTSGEIAFAYRYNDTWSGDDAWYDWQEFGGDIPDGSITADKLAEESVNFEKLSADMLAQAKSFITEISGDGQPQAIPLALGPGFSADKTYKLSIEARLVSGSGTVDLGPNMPTASAGYYHWDNTGDYLTLTSDWQTAWVDNVQGITSAGLQLYGSTAPVTVQLRNIHLTDTDGNDVIDQQALREVGTCIPSPDDSPDTRPENKVLPTLAYVQDMLAKLEARIAALEGGSE